MKISIFFITFCLFHSVIASAQTHITKQLITSIAANIKHSQSSDNPELIQPISRVKGHYNPFTGTTLFVDFDKLQPTEQLNKELLNLASEDKKLYFNSSQQNAKTLSHHIYQLERKLSVLEKSDNTSEQIEYARHQLSELTIKKAKINNQYQSAKKAVLNDVITANTLQNLLKQLSANVCHLGQTSKQSLKSMTLVLAGIQNTEQEITWHFSNLLSCQDNSLQEQTNFLNSRQTSRF
ncbi:hypothetical protein [Pseudoalteromonas sp.]|uniref:hypothetical protein n=1 Tax=Pseudoalteromonas sp. TaxID=53249 RepID=UPI00356571C9